MVLASVVLSMVGCSVVLGVVVDCVVVVGAAVVVDVDVVVVVVDVVAGGLQSSHTAVRERLHVMSFHFPVT